MSSYTEENAPNAEWLKRPLSERPRGIIPAPQPVLDVIAEGKARDPVNYTSSYEALELNALTLLFYYDGVNVLYRPTPQGPEVLAVEDEIWPILDRMNQEELNTVTVKQP